MKSFWLLFLFGLIGAAGCGGTAKDGPPVEDVAIVRSLVSQMSDASRNPEYFRGYFAADSIPADGERKRYAKLYFKAAGPPSMKANVATVQVVVTNDDSSTPLGQVEWTF